MAMGLMMIIPQPCIGLAMLIGMLIAETWKKLWPVTSDKYMFAVISGMIAGEGIGGVINAIIALAGISTRTTLGCPAGMC